MIGPSGKEGKDEEPTFVEEGTELLREEPLAAVPLAAHCGSKYISSSAVCYGCLRPLRGRPPRDHGGGGGEEEALPPPPPLPEGAVLHPSEPSAPPRTFCSSSCLASSLSDFYRIEAETPGGFRELEESCTRNGERFPRIAARLFAKKLLGAVDEVEEKEEEEENEKAAEEIVNSTREAQEALSALCFARVSPPYPPSWVETHAAFVQGLERWAAEKRNKEKKDKSFSSSSLSSLSLPSLIAETVSLDAWAATLARIHLNAFRVDAVWPATTREELMASMLSSLVGSASKGSSSSSSSSFSSDDDDPGEQAGTAVYAAASLANHSCYPSARPSFPRANSTLALVATRDLLEKEEVTISYVDESLPLRTRRASLEFGYGFFCTCARCLAEEREEEEGKKGGGGG